MAAITAQQEPEAEEIPASIIGRVAKYMQDFPDSDVSMRQLQRYITQGGAIDWTSGALYLPSVGVPDPEVYAEPEHEICPVTGARVKISELHEAGIAYTIVEEDQDFVVDDIEWWTDEQGQCVERLPGELRRLREFKTRQPSLQEPLTREEAIGFIQVVLEPDILLGGKEGEAAKFKARQELARRGEVLMLRYNTKKARLQHLLSDAWERLSEHDGKVRASIYKCLGQEMPRVRASVQRQNIGEPWSYSGQWFIGTREGIIHDQAGQNDLNFSKQDQHHLPGEKVEGSYMFGEELERARLEDNFTLLYDSSKRGPDGGAANRGNSEQRLYLRRQADKRAKTCAKLLWYVLTWPQELLDSLMKQVRVMYRTSIKSNAPGPGRRQINGHWLNVPLEGEAARQELRRNPGSLKGNRFHPQFRFHKGESWHKNTINREHLQMLEEAYERRCGRIHISVGGEAVTESLPTYGGLPLEYVKGRYLN